MSQHINKAEAQRRAKAVGQAHTVKEYEIQAAIAAKGVSNDQAWRATMALPPTSRGRRPNQGGG
jgi:hypothetical protein